MLGIRWASVPVAANRPCASVRPPEPYRPRVEPRIAAGPHAGERAPVGERLSATLLTGTRKLVHDGLDRLQRQWDSLPRIKVRLLREGRDLDRELQAPDPKIIGRLTARGCDWYIEVCLLRSSRANGRNPNARQTAKLADIREELVGTGHTPPPGGRPPGELPPNAEPPDNRQLANVVLKLTNVMEEMVESQNTVIERLGRIDGRMGDAAGRAYEDQFRAYFIDQAHMAISQLSLPRPGETSLRWSDRHRGGWAKVAAELGFEPWENPRARYCDFIYRLRWPDTRLPDLYIVGESGIQVHAELLDKATELHAQIEAKGRAVRTLLVGSGFSDRMQDLGGAEAVAARGLVWVERPEDLESDGWQDVSEIGQVLKAWLTEQGAL